VAVNLDEQQRLVRDLGEHAGMIIAQPRLLVVGGSIPEAFYNMFKLERACQVQVAVLSCNVEVQMPPQEVIDDSYRMYLPTTRRPFGVLEWPALLKKLDAIDTSYRD
jgi:ribulose-5-phosphate 4-epimerase/fuculose-1-phosphate aldolase